ncbi:heterokaryon incompatibility protein-domain-containing protein [Paraphoma chrysanthemicola]|nr:heterokaryon incompatibility protein-domain-containing protein [Paraphoma chrysanthemicola]
MSQLQNDAGVPAQNTVSQIDTHSPSSRCSVCLDLDLSSEASTSTASADVWRMSALECESCAVVWKVTQPFLSNARHLYRLEEDPDIRISLDRGGGLSFEVLRSAPIAVYQRGEIRCDDDGACPWPSIKPECFGLRNAKFASSRILRWLKDCESHCGNCDRGLALQELPTRIIEIQAPDRIRLVATDEFQQGRYACLSHCWGGIEILRTTKATYLDFQRTIPWCGLPPTFKHAIEVTWHAGLRYIWIDSLCIIQDDNADWRHEGSKMASIYTKSYFTLAAVTSRDARDGLYRSGRQGQFLKHEIQRPSGRATYKLYVHQPHEHRQFLTQEMPLFQRAWFLQERLLSTRVIFFGSKELYWECCESRWCECGCLPETPTTSTRRPSKVKTPEDIYGWHIVVSQYTQLHLTFQKDRLPALQGLAKAWQQKLQSHYLAGLWEEHILEELSWSVSLPHRRPKVYLGPSWSWVSVSGHVTWDPHFAKSDDKVVSIISISATPAGKDPMGEIASGDLVLKGRCVRATTKYDGLYPEISNFRDEMIRWNRDIKTPPLIDVLLVEMLRTEGSSWCLVLKQKSGQNVAYERVGCVCYSPDLVKWFDNHAEEMVVTVV